MIEKFSKKEWSKKISEAIDDKNEKELISLMKCQKKINKDEILEEPFETKAYMKNLTYDDAVLRFKLRAKVFKPIKTHFKSDPVFTEELWSCKECSLLQTSFHLIHKCVLYDDEREGLDLDEDEDLVFFLRRILERREREGEEEN